MCIHKCKPIFIFKWKKLFETNLDIAYLSENNCILQNNVIQMRITEYTKTAESETTNQSLRAKQVQYFLKMHLHDSIFIQ